MKDSYTLKSLAVLLENNKISSKEVTTEYLKNIDNGKELNCYNTISQEKALIDAEKSDERRKSQNLRSKYDGIPIGIKDLFCTKGITTTASSRILSNFIPNYESTVTQNCDDAGLISLGKLNCDEFAMGSTNKTSFFGSVKNPWKSINSDNELVPGVLVRHPDQEDWGLGQVQSSIGNRITVNFEHKGKQIINCDIISLVLVDEDLI